MAKRTKHQKGKIVSLRNFVIAAVGLVVVLVSMLAYKRIEALNYQKSLDPFYDISAFSSQGNPGDILRSQPIDVEIDGGTAQRIIYRSQKADGANAFSSGMVFIPTTPSASARPVLAWAHGTVGMGDACAPSRLKNPTLNLTWISEVMKLGWFVTATDYAGLGTEGTEAYLVGQTEAHDVLNSVRAARQIAQSQASNDYVVWGHSQGGHSALFTASLSNQYAPELNLKGTVASAPAAELVPLLDQQYGTAVDWVIGPEALVSWPKYYPNLDPKSVTTKAGFDNYKKIADKCIGAAAIDGIIRTKLKEQFFSENLVNVPAWRAVAQDQTAPMLASNQAVLVAESLTDTVVLPNTTARYIQRSCEAGSNITSLWVNDVGHIKLAQVIAPNVISWLNDRILDRPSNRTCDQPLPVQPAADV